MSTAQETTNKAMFSRFHDAMNTGDAELISKTIDEVFEPDVLIRTPRPVQATGAQALKHSSPISPGAWPRIRPRRG